MAVEIILIKLMTLYWDKYNLFKNMYKSKDQFNYKAKFILQPTSRTLWV